MEDFRVSDVAEKTAEPVFAVEPAIEKQPPKALSVVAAKRVSPVMKKAIRRHRKQGTLIFTILVPLLVVGMVLVGVYCKPDGSFSMTGMLAIAGAVLLALIWEGIVLLTSSNRRHPRPYDNDRVNELYEQGIVCTSPFGRVVLEYDKVQTCVETRDWVALYGNDTEIVWQAEDLTAEDAQTLFLALAAHLPPAVFCRKGVIRPRQMESAALPRFFFEAPLENYDAFWSAKEARRRSFWGMAKQSVPMMAILSMVLACALCESFDVVNEEAIARALVEHFASPLGLATAAVTASIHFWLMVAGVVVCLTVCYLLIAWEQNKLIRERNKQGVKLSVTAGGFRIQDGANFTVLSGDRLKKTVSVNDRYLRVRLDRQMLLVPRESLCAGTLWRQFVDIE